jgi:predicted solute-binding protein
VLQIQALARIRRHFGRSAPLPLKLETLLDGQGCGTNFLNTDAAESFGDSPCLQGIVYDAMPFGLGFCPLPEGEQVRAGMQLHGIRQASPGGLNHRPSSTCVRLLIVLSFAYRRRAAPSARIFGQLFTPRRDQNPARMNGSAGLKRLRISAISYLNTAPLMWDLEHGGWHQEFDIAYTVPSECARDLQQGRRDIGIIPTAAYAMIRGLAVLPGVAIASKQAVRSILLVSHKPLREIRSVALDHCSLTSAALIRILFEKFWGGGRQFSSAAPDLELMLASHDGALVIGDPALKVDRSGYQTWDLAEEWTRLTGKAFVFAFWAARQDAI